MRAIPVSTSRPTFLHHGYFPTVDQFHRLRGGKISVENLVHKSTCMRDSYAERETETLHLSRSDSGKYVAYVPHPERTSFQAGEGETGSAKTQGITELLTTATSSLAPALVIRTFDPITFGKHHSQYYYRVSRRSAVSFCLIYGSRPSR